MASPAAIAATIKRDREKTLKFMASIASSLNDNETRIDYIGLMLFALCEKLEVEIEQPVELTQEQKDSALADIHAAAKNWTDDEQPIGELEPVAATGPDLPSEPDASLAQG